MLRSETETGATDPKGELEANPEGPSRTDDDPDINEVTWFETGAEAGLATVLVVREVESFSVTEEGVSIIAL